MITSANLLKQFLLGSLSRDERDRIEREYFSDSERFEELEVAENELIDSYVRGELSEEEQQRFRLHYLTSPQRRSRVEFARSLNEVAHKASAPPIEENKPVWWRRWSRPKEAIRWPQFALISACFAVTLAFSSLLMMQNLELKQELQKQETANAKLRESQEALARQIAQLGSSSSESAVKSQPEEHAMLKKPLIPGASLTLVPSVLRGGKETEPTLILPIQAASIRMKLVLDENERNFRSFEAEIQLVGSRRVPQTITGHEIAKGADGTTVLFGIPSNSIRPGDYIVTLYGLDAGSTRNEIGSYTFRAISGPS